MHIKRNYVENKSHFMFVHNTNVCSIWYALITHNLFYKRGQLLKEVTKVFPKDLLNHNCKIYFFFNL